MTMRSYEFVLQAKDAASAVVRAVFSEVTKSHAVMETTKRHYTDTAKATDMWVMETRKLSEALASGEIKLGTYAVKLGQLRDQYRQLKLEAAIGGPTSLAGLVNAIGAGGSMAAGGAAAAHAGGGGGGHGGGGMMGVLGLSSFTHMFQAMIPATVGAYVVSGIHKAEQDELQQARLKAVLHAGGGNGISRGDINAFAEMSARDTMFKKGDVLESASRLSIYHNLKGDEFFGAMKAVQDLASVMGTDLPTAATQLGRALEDPEQGMQALRRAGVILSDEMKEQIKNTFASGDQAKAQAMLIEEINKRVGGTAKEMDETSAGEMDRATKAIDKLSKVLGVALLPVIDSIAEKIALLNPKLGADPERQLAFSSQDKRQRLGAAPSEDEIQAAIKANQKATEESLQRTEEIGARGKDRKSWSVGLGVAEGITKLAGDIRDKNELESEAQLQESLRKEMGNLLLALKRERKTGVGAARKDKEDQEAEMMEQVTFGDGGFEEAYANIKSNEKLYDKLHESVKEDKKKQEQADREKAKRQEEADRYTEHYRDANPWARRERDTAGLESVKDLIPQEAYDWQKKEIAKQFERSTTDRDTEKRQRQKAAGDLQARESGFLVGHQSQVGKEQDLLNEAKKANQIAAQQKALLERQIALQEEINRKWSQDNPFGFETANFN